MGLINANTLAICCKTGAAIAILAVLVALALSENDSSVRFFVSN